LNAKKSKIIFKLHIILLCKLFVFQNLIIGVQ
jgi:hypothetical protein